MERRRGIWLSAEEFRKLVEMSPIVLRDLNNMANAKFELGTFASMAPPASVSTTNDNNNNNLAVSFDY